MAPVTRRACVALLGALVLIGAGAPAPARAASMEATRDRPPATLDAADYSWYRPTVGELAGIPVVARYLVPASWQSGKALTATEARWLQLQGRSVVLNYEWAPRGASAGYAAGVRDARIAELARAEVGAPAGLPIYFSADWDVQPREVTSVLGYLAGAASVLGRARVGVYGGYRVVAAALDAGYRWAWQTYAWSRGRWDARARLRQTANGALWHGQGDRDTSAGDVGAWVPAGPPVRHGDEIRPVHVPPRPVGAPIWYRVRAGDYLARVAARNGTTWPTLARLNRLRNPDRIYPGELLRLH